MENHDYEEDTIKRQLNPGEIAERLRDIFYPGRNMNGKVLHEVIELIDEIDPPKPEIEEGRLYYVWDDRDEIEGNKYAGAVRNPLNLWENMEPVHRRWEEWTEDEQNNFRMTLKEWEKGLISTREVVKIAYFYIAWEQHP